MKLDIKENCDLTKMADNIVKPTSVLRKNSLTTSYASQIDSPLSQAQQEAQLPQRNSASAAHVYLGWLTDRAMHRTPQNRRGLYYFLTFKRSDSKGAGRKRILAWNNHSRSFKVIHFAVSYRPARGSISSYNIAYRTSEVFEDEDNPRLTPRPRRTSEHIRMNLIFTETRIIGLHFCRWLYGFSFIQIYAVRPKRRIFSATECVLAVQGHPGSMILVPVPIEIAYATSY